MNLPNIAATEALAQRIAAKLTAPLLITLSGALGAGKTTFVRALLRACGVKGAIKSPTFSLVESYDLTFDHRAARLLRWHATSQRQASPTQFHHFDLYRVQEPTELHFMGFRDYFTDHTICCIEWPERAKGQMAVPDLSLSFEFEGIGRKVICVAGSAKGEQMLCGVD